MMQDIAETPKRKSKRDFNCIVLCLLFSIIIGSAIFKKEEQPEERIIHTPKRKRNFTQNISTYKDNCSTN